MAFAFMTRKPALQQTVGRRPFESAPMVQPKLQIGAVNDPLEREADAVADAVMRKPGSPIAISRSGGEQISRACAQCESEEEVLQAKPRGRALTTAGAPFDGQLASSRRGGTPMSPNLRTTMEQRFGADFSGVRFHTDERSAALAKQINARAFSSGNDVFFGRGEFRPEASEGQHLIAHELTHTIQQRGSGAVAPIQRKPGSATISDSCNDSLLGYLKPEVAAALAEARDATSQTVNRLLDLHMLGEERAVAWNNSKFSCWFGTYDEKRFFRIIDNMIEILGILRDKRLNIRCGKRKNVYGVASPGVMQITLGLLWVDKLDERAQTVIHEASHIAGVVSAKEGKHYGKGPIRDMARTNPNAVIRMSDAYGYAAVDQSLTTPCK